MGNNIEMMQPKMDRRLAELSGNYKGLSDETQTQIRRIDQIDTRLWELRHSLEEEIHTKWVEIEQQQQQAASSIRLAAATNDDAVKRSNARMARLEKLIDEKIV